MMGSSDLKPEHGQSIIRKEGRQRVPGSAVAGKRERYWELVKVLS